MTTHFRYSQTTVAGLAGALSVTFFEVLNRVLRLQFPGENLAIWAAAILSTLSVYTISFQFGDWLHRRYLWRFGARINLNGSWDVKLTNLRDGTIRIGEAYFHHDRDSITARGVNEKPGTAGPFSTWSTRLVILTEDTVFLLYEIESSQDPGRNFKRGVIRLQIPGSFELPLVGDFWDNAPSEDRGPISFTFRKTTRRLPDSEHPEGRQAAQLSRPAEGQ